MTLKEPRLLSIVVPAFNEEENLERLAEKVLEHGPRSGCEIELIVVDDGSSDRTPEILARLSSEDPRIRYVQLSRNFGQQAAICAGLDSARGDLIAMLDADLQDPPELIPELVAKIDEGHDLVFGVRQGRKDPLLTRIYSSLFWATLRWLSGFKIPKNLSVMRIFNRRFLEEFKRFPERQKFIEGIFMWIGMRRTTHPIPHRPRHAGATKYNFRKKMRLAIDALTGFSDRPLTVAIGVGLLLTAIGLGFMTYVSIGQIVFDTYAQGWVSQFSIVLLVGGIQMLFLGVLGKYIGRLFYESKQRPQYIVQSTSDRDDNKYERA